MHFKIVSVDISETISLPISDTQLYFFVSGCYCGSTCAKIALKETRQFKIKAYAHTLYNN